MEVSLLHRIVAHIHLSGGIQRVQTRSQSQNVYIWLYNEDRVAKNILQSGVYDQLRQRIQTRQISPGATLREEHLAAEMNVSRTPVREALRKLADEGFVEYVPHRGARLLNPTPELVREIFLIREALEGMAAREAALLMDSGHLILLREQFEELRSRIAQGDLEDVGDRIHAEVLNACGNERLGRLMSAYCSQVGWLQAMASGVPGRLAHAFREHESILCALESRDPEWAETAARAHVRATMRELLNSFPESNEGNGAQRRRRSKKNAD